MIKQAIIPLAGLGTRLLPLTSVFAKELLPINGKPGIEYILDEETDQKFGAGILYNINNRSAITIEVMSSKVLDSSFKIGYQINF